MRKLTGYIGALLIVFALAGSVLTGYALNINGHTAVTNEYETVTDVSGLYAHSDEKNYIEYNPASNYTGYTHGYGDTENNPAQTHKFLKITEGSIHYRVSDQHLIINGTDQGVIPAYVASEKLYVVFDYGYLYLETGPTLTLWLTDGSNVTSITNDVWFWVNGNHIGIEIGTYTKTYEGVKNIMGYCTTGDHNYYAVRAATINDIYTTDSDNITMICYPYRGIITGDTYREMNTGTVKDASVFYSNGVLVEPEITKYATVGGTYANTGISTAWSILYPISVNNGYGIGVDFTQSNRVNNYFIGYEGDSTIQTAVIDLSNITGLTNYMNVDNSNDPVRIVQDNGGAGTRTVGNTTYEYDYVALTYPYVNNTSGSVIKNYNYKLSEIITAYANIPQNTEKIIISVDSANSITYNPNVTVTTPLTIDSNVATFNYNNEYQNYLLFGSQYYQALNVNNQYGLKDYIECDPSNGVVYVYNYAGVKVNTTTWDQIYIAFPNIGNYNNGILVSQLFGSGNWHDTGGNSGTTWLNDTVKYPGTATSNLYTANLTLYYYVNNTSPIYMDITKGISIKSDNIAPTLWNNNYENGDIKILFRADNINATYHNDITVSNNDISVDFNDKQFYVKLNNDETVNVGMWRNIVLDIDLSNGKLNVIPVKTFNSYTNVVMSNAIVQIGDLINAAPINTLYWGTTTNSLMFNVYSTDVFMNTYGVVMVNPTLDITNYFTDLNQFYRLNLYNFATYGDSMTINGETMNVINGTISYDDITIELRDMYITYADGNVSIGDSHTSVELGQIATTSISMAGAWYFQTDLERGHTSQKMVYEWNWGDFIFNNTQFCVFYIGFALAGLIIARKYCNLSIIDYAVYIASIVIALSVQVIG